MNDIAERAGVSRATVSLILRGRAADLRISEKTRLRVLQIAEETGYRRNRLLDAVVSGHNRVLGLLTAAPEGESSARILAGAMDEAEAQGYFVKALRLHNTELLDDLTVERCLENRLSGLLVLYASPLWLEKLRSVMASYRVPVAVADDCRAPQGAGIHILTDYEMAMEQAVAHLTELGHTRIAFIAGEEDDLASQEREDAFRRAMSARNLLVPSRFVVHGPWESDAIERATRTILSDTHPPSALVSSVDVGALCALRTARGMGYSIPRDLSVIALGNSRVSLWADPPLTLVAQPFYEIGRRATSLLLGRIAAPPPPENWSDPLHRERLPTQLVARASTATPRETLAPP